MSNNLTALSDSELHASFKNLGGRECEIVADIIAHLAEVDKRKLYLTYGFPNLTRYCHAGLACSEDVAGIRVIAARLAARYPVVLTLLREQRLHLTGIRTIAQHLGDDNYEARLLDACGKTRDELERLVAAWAPKPDVPARVVMVKQTPAPELLMRMHDTPAEPPPRVEPQRPAPLPKPLSPKRFKVEFTVSEEEYAVLMRQRNTLRHVIPSGDIGQIYTRALGNQDARDEARKFGKCQRPAKKVDAELPLKPSRDGNSESIIEEDIVMNRAPDRATRRAVAERDGYQCCYVAEDGRRCSATAWLEYDHKLAWSLNGPTFVDNLHLLCKAHNRNKHPFRPGTVPR